MIPRRILVLGAQVPFTRGGAEILCASLTAELQRRGFQADHVTLPFNWTGRGRVLKSTLAWRLVDLTEVAGEPVDLVIATRFPTYAVAHPRKVVWLVHQYRQAYDMLGSPFGDLGDGPEDRALIELVRGVDARALGEATDLFSISRNVAERLARNNGLAAVPLYPPPKLGEAYRCEAAEGYVFTVGRLDRTKRFDLLVRALPHTRNPVRAVVAGSGPERDVLAAEAERLGVADRVELPGRVDDDRLLDLYARCRGVFYAPYDEDYGYVTVEAYKSGKPVVTTADAGGVLEFVRHGETGFVAPSAEPRAVAAALDRLWEEGEAAARMGERGRAEVAHIGWDEVVRSLVGAESPDEERPAAGSTP